MIDTSKAKAEIITQNRINETDTGSVDVQIALLTEKIRTLIHHCQANAKDFSSKRGLLKMVGKRRRFLHYLKKTNPTRYEELTNRIGIRA
jgi:small subunit ribosomal protein S15